MYIHTHIMMSSSEEQGEGEGGEENKTKQNASNHYSCRLSIENQSTYSLGESKTKPNFKINQD